MQILLNCYAPNKTNDQLEYAERIKTLMENQTIDKNEFILVGGDLNVTLQQNCMETTKQQKKFKS